MHSMGWIIRTERTQLRWWRIVAYCTVTLSDSFFFLDLSYSEASQVWEHVYGCGYQKHNPSKHIIRTTSKTLPQMTLNKYKSWGRPAKVQLKHKKTQDWTSRGSRHWPFLHRRCPDRDWEWGCGKGGRSWCRAGGRWRWHASWRNPFQGMGWLRVVGSLKSWVSFAKEPYKRDNILQKRPIISWILKKSFSR